MWHMLFSCIAALLLLRYINPAPTGMPSWAQFKEYYRGLVPIAICTTLNAGLNNMSLEYVSLFVNQVIKATAPLPAAAFSFLFAGKRYSTRIIASVCGIVVGSILANAPSLGRANQSDNSLFGVVICGVSLLANSLKPVLQMLAMNATAEKAKLAPAVVLFYDSAVSFCLMLLYWLLSAERGASIAYLADPHTTLIGLVIIVAGASMAFCFNLATYYFVALTSALCALPLLAHHRSHGPRTTPAERKSAPLPPYARRAGPRRSAPTASRSSSSRPRRSRRA